MNNNTLNLIAATLLCAFIPTIASAASISGNGTWESTLQGRDLDGDLSTAEAYYDTVLDITWLADANYAYTTGYNANGSMNWPTANAWLEYLNPYGSDINFWRLPATVDVGNDGATYTDVHQGVDYGYNITTHSEMSHMYYETLGNTAWYDTSGAETGCTLPDYCLTNTGPFSNIQYDFYWSATEYAPHTLMAWDFDFRNGYQDDHYKNFEQYVWAVHDGDVGVALPTSEVPIPAAAWLFSSGLLGLLAMARKRRS
jgi:hypothetical protein